jgi:hypothetical protein
MKSSLKASWQVLLITRSKVKPLNSRILKLIPHSAAEVLVVP